MRKPIESTLVSLDGVIESPNRWTNFDEEDAQYAMEQLGNFDAFVMGRVTYEFFRANWSGVTGDPYEYFADDPPKQATTPTGPTRFANTSSPPPWRAPTGATRRSSGATSEPR